MPSWHDNRNTSLPFSSISKGIDQVLKCREVKTSKKVEVDDPIETE